MDQITNHVEQALDRQTSQFKGKTNCEKMLTILIEPVQRFENVAWDVLTKRGLDTAEGAQLDQVGSIIGERRQGKVDEDYRRFLRAAIVAHKSNGTVEDLILVTTLIIDDAAAVIKMYPGYPAGLTIEIQDVILSDDLANVLISFLRRTVAATVKLVLWYWPSEEEEMYTLAIADFLSVASLVGATSFTTTATTGFPSSGSIVIDEGLAAEETLTYAGKTGTSFTGTAAAAFAHPIGATVTWAGSPGLGLGDTSDSLIGGDMAGALE